MDRLPTRDALPLYGGRMTEFQRQALTKVLAVTLGFWLIKILATISERPAATQ